MLDEKVFFKHVFAYPIFYIGPFIVIVVYLGVAMTHMNLRMAFVKNL